MGIGARNKVEGGRTVSETILHRVSHFRSEYMVVKALGVDLCGLELN